MVHGSERNVGVDGVLEHLGVRVDRVRRLATVAGRELDLTPTEHRLLELLLGEPGKTLSRQFLLEEAIAGQALVLPRTIDVHVCSLRRKLGDPKLIETVRGVGYRFRSM